jgi:putative ABC transport system permease protein
MNIVRSAMRFLRRIGYWLQFRRREAELREELVLHRALLDEELAHEGLDVAAARKRMGNETLMRDEARDVWLAPAIEALFKDCRHAWRALGRAPGFSLVAILTLAVGIGANTAIFSVVHHLLLAPLPFADGNRIVRLGTRSASAPDALFDLPASLLIRLKDRSRALEDFAAADFVPATLGDTSSHDMVPGARITPSLLHMLRVGPVAGRALTEEDAAAGAPPVVMISYGLWQSRFGAAPDVVGKAISINGIRRTIVGVTPRDLTVPMRCSTFPRPSSFA